MVNALQRIADFRFPYERLKKVSLETPKALLSRVLVRLEEDDLEGGIAAFQGWADLGHQDDADQERLAAFAVLLIERLAAGAADAKASRAIEPIADPDRREAVEAGYPTMVSTHFTALTATIVRQRSQIGELTTLVERMSHRLS